MLASPYAEVNSCLVTYRWDDVAVFLALHRERTTGRAAAILGCSQPTIVRRIAALEAAAGLTLFHRTTTGFEPTDQAMALLPMAERIELSAMEFEAELCAQRGESSHVIRLTLLDHFENLFVPILRQFRERWPDMRVELLASDRIYDLARGEADIAIRGRLNSVDDAIVARSLPDCAWTLYAPADMAVERRPASWESASAHVIAIPDGSPGQLPIFLKLAAIAAEGSGSLRCSNYNALRSAMVSSHAISALPVTVGDTDPLIVRCFPPAVEFDVPVYLLARRASLRRPPLRELYERIHAHFLANPSLLTGRP